MQVDWYFDFVSPYAYLQLMDFKRLPDSLEIRYRPVLFAGLLDHWGQLGPAEVPPKAFNTFKMCARHAALHEIPFRARRQETHRLRLVDHAVRRQHDDPAEDH